MNPVGSVADFVSRLYSRFPRGWAGSPAKAPVFAALLTGMATAHANFYALVQFVGQQIYLQSTVGGFLDTWAADFFGTFLLRDSGEADASFLSRIRGGLLAPKNTRAAVARAAQISSGATPVIVEPWRGPDTFALGVDTFALGVAGAGRLGSLRMPYQAFVFLPGVSGSGATEGIALGVQPFALGAAQSGNYLQVGSQPSSVENILSAIDFVRPASVTVFVNFA